MPRARALLVVVGAEEANEDDDKEIGSLASSIEVRGVVAVEYDILVESEVKPGCLGVVDRATKVERVRDRLAKELHLC